MNDELRSKIIQQLLDLKAVSISPNAPFTYASGMKSPIYTDLRMTISKPVLRSDITKGLSAEIKKAYPSATVIGGVATAGIPHAAWVAEELGLPLIYVRSKPKDHGAGKQIEGQLQADDQVVLIDDLISTGGSVLKAVEAVRKEDIQVIGVASILVMVYRIQLRILQNKILNYLVCSTTIKWWIIFKLAMPYPLKK
ncbi:Orotate phosphoribosyltransferase [Pediococcus pentosaceus]|uniref:Orotate phosphoribosyltransferase n=1 Tax=Pediococcus pentosaceus TaxID=1255 RepID=A0A1Y0VX29_PEDPE|nr:Orotate phosphoribosyltransferase [Pediococcus pentosaceus]